VAYCTQSDIEDRITASVLAQLTDDTNGTTTDTDVMDEIIDLAQGLVDSYLRGKHTVPYTTTVPDMVRNWTVTIAARYLYQRRIQLAVPETLQDDFKEAKAQMREVQKGLLIIDDSGSEANTAGYYKSNKTSDSRIFTSNDSQTGTADKYFSSCRITPSGI